LEAYTSKRKQTKEFVVVEGVRRTAASALLVVLATAVWWIGPDPTTVGPALRHPQSYVDRVGADEAALTGVCVLCWLVLAWLAVGLAFTAAGALPGVTGRVCDVVAGRLLPRTLRRGAAVALGLSVATAGAGASVALWDPADRPAASSSRSVPVDWPPDRSGGTAADLDWPATAASGQQHLRAESHRAFAVVVRPGDSLWRIAARQLAARSGATAPPTAAQIAREWPRWYAANRAVIGPDPNLIYPGQRLTPPT
jgi:hypothetical protein